MFTLTKDEEMVQSYYNTVGIIQLLNPEFFLNLNSYMKIFDNTADLSVCEDQLFMQKIII